MKKFFGFILFLFALSAASALSSFSDYSNSTVSLGVVFPYMSHDYKIDGQNKITIQGTGFNLNYRHMNQDFTWGLFLDSDFFFPTNKTEYEGDTSVSKNVSNYDYFFGMDFLGGVYTVLFKSNGINIPGGIGIHADGYLDKINGNKDSVYTLGFGGWVNCEINVSKTFGIYGGLKVTYDFYYRQSAYNSAAGGKTTRNSGNCSAWSLIPAVGVAVHF